MHCIVCKRGFWLIQTCIKAMKTSKLHYRMELLLVLWYTHLAKEVTPVLLTNVVMWLVNMLENTSWYSLISASLKGYFNQKAYHFPLVWAELCKTTRNCTFFWFEVRFFKLFLLCLHCSVLQSNYQLGEAILTLFTIGITIQSWKPVEKFMPPMVVSFYGFFYRVLPFAPLSYAGAVLWFTL